MRAHEDPLRERRELEREERAQRAAAPRATAAAGPRGRSTQDLVTPVSPGPQAGVFQSSLFCII